MMHIEFRMIITFICWGPGSGRRDHLYDSMYITTKVLAFVGRYCVHEFLLLF